MSESSRTSSSSEAKYDPELDIRSEFFNPLKALYSPDTPIPVKDAPIYNNVAEFESMLRRQNAGTSVRVFYYLF